jgi:hypothetical protein
MLLNRGIYFFENKDIRGVLAGGASPHGEFATLLAKWPWDNTVSPDSSNVFLELWLVEPLQAYGGGAYSIRNLSSGKYLASRNGGSVVVDKSLQTACEYWTITPHPSGYYRITNIQFGKSIGGQHPNHYYTVLGQNFNERWDISKPLSCSGADIDTALKKSLPLSPTGGSGPIYRRLKAHHTAEIYLIPSRGIFEEIRKTINRTGYRKELFDCDDFTFEFKAAVAAWFSGKIAVAGIPVFCGMIFADFLDAAGNVAAGHAYNFLLSDDHSRLEYFDPQGTSGRLPDMLSQLRAQPYLALC